MSLVKDNLPIFGIAKASKLNDYATTENDVSRGVSRMPLVLARIYEEDIKFEKTQKQPTKQFKQSPSALQREQLSESDRFINNLNDSIDMRISAHRSSINVDNMLKNSMDSRLSR